jgi:disulfide bond formation protein DsbB
MTRQNLIVIAALGSALMLAAAFGFQYIGEMPPCKMCIWQRWPHGAAVVIGLIGALFYHRGIAILGALAALTTACVGLYHAGVEQDWWEGPSTCTSGPVSDLSVQDLLTKILEAPIVRCDEIPWELFGLSMAGWNALVSFGLAGIWLLAARR